MVVIDLTSQCASPVRKGGPKAIPGKEDEEDCPICLQPIEDKTDEDGVDHSCASVDGCNHFSCIDCLQEWVKRGNNSCPQCRYKFSHIIHKGTRIAVKATFNCERCDEALYEWCEGGLCEDCFDRDGDDDRETEELDVSPWIRQLASHNLQQQRTYNAGARSSAQRAHQSSVARAQAVAAREIAEAQFYIGERRERRERRTRKRNRREDEGDKPHHHHYCERGESHEHAAQVGRPLPALCTH